MRGAYVRSILLVIRVCIFLHPRLDAITMRRATFILPLFALVLMGTTSHTEPTAHSQQPTASSACSANDYYTIDLVSTKRVTGSRLARGAAEVRFSRSPFGVALTPDGSYTYDLSIRIDRLRPARSGVYAVWVTTPDLQETKLLGVLDEDFKASGQVSWNKYLVVITLEESADTIGTLWQGPIVLRGISRSGLMHTMAGHGPFEEEPCAVYGY